MGLPGFFWGNLGRTAAVRSSKQAAPACFCVTKEGSGSASMTALASAPDGISYSARDYEFEEYVVQIHDVTGGSEIGQAKYRWRRASDSAWQASGVTTPGGGAALDDGVSIDFDAGPGNDFALNDTWTIRVAHFRGKNRPFDSDPNTAWRTGPAGVGVATRQYMSLDFGAAADLDSLILADHNLTSGATVTLKGHAGTDPDPFLDDFQILNVRADGTSYDDKTHQGAFADGGNLGFSPRGASTYYNFIGKRTTFTTISVNSIAAAAVYTGAGTMSLKVEYWNGSAWTAVSGLSDGTASGGDTCQQDGEVTFDMPADWAAGGSFPAGASGIRDAGFYFVRISLTPSAGKTVTSIDDAEQTVPYAIVAPAWTEAVTWASGTILKRFAAARNARSVRLELDDPTNADGWLEIHDIFVGEETVLASADYTGDVERSIGAAADDEAILSGAGTATLYNVARALRAPLLLTNADKDAFLAIHGDLYDEDLGEFRPFFFDADRDSPELLLAAFAGPVRTRSRMGEGSTAMWEARLELDEIVKGRTS